MKTVNIKRTKGYMNVKVLINSTEAEIKRQLVSGRRR